MTSKENLETIVDAVIWSYEECGGEVPQSILDTLNEIKQMVRNQPTLSECIKEWKDRGWTVDELKQFPVIEIWKLNKEQNVVDNIYIYPKKLNSQIDFYANSETLNLLTKTLKALEVEDES